MLILVLVIYILRAMVSYTSKSFMFEETDLISGAGGTAINGLTFNLTSNILSIESDAEYGDTDTDGGDWGFCKWTFNKSRCICGRRQCIYNNRA